MYHFQKLSDMLSDLISLGIFRGAFIKVLLVLYNHIFIICIWGVMYFSVLRVI